MKKSTIISGLLLAGALFLTNCGSNTIEADAKKVADLQCKAQKLIAKAATGDTTVAAESQKISQEAEKLGQELKTKYTNPIDIARFATAYAEAMKDCK
jgi:hypothetical protein